MYVRLCDKPLSIIGYSPHKPYIDAKPTKGTGTQARRPKPMTRAVNDGKHRSTAAIWRWGERWMRSRVNESLPREEGASRSHADGKTRYRLVQSDRRGATNTTAVYSIEVGTETDDTLSKGNINNSNGSQSWGIHQDRMRPPTGSCRLPWELPRDATGCRVGALANPWAPTVITIGTCASPRDSTGCRGIPWDRGVTHARYRGRRPAT